MHQIPFEKGDFSKEDSTYQRLEDLYLKRIEGYDKQELGVMSKMLAMTMLMHRQEYGDFLGEIAGESNLLNQNNGQFFTPFAVTTLMAKMQLANAKEILDKKGIITVSDPAVGGGSCLLAAAKALYDQEIDPRSAAQFDAIDVSRNAFNMAYIQLAAADLQAVVRHGNTLTLEIWENRPTPQLRYFDRAIREQFAIARMQQLITDPGRFFAEPAIEPMAQTMQQTNDGEQGEALNDEQPEAPIQQSLFGTEEFSGSASTGKHKNITADIVMPTTEQLGLFSDERVVE